MNALRKEKVDYFNSYYPEIINHVDKTMKLTADEMKCLKNNHVPRFFASIPFRANQAFPEQKAITNVSLYIAASRDPEVFSTIKGQNIRERISLFLNLNDGDKDVIDLCLDILEEASLMDHYKDKDQDLLTSHPNPLNMNVIDFNTEKRRLNLKRSGYAQEVLDIIHDVKLNEILNGFWFG